MEHFKERTCAFSGHRPKRLPWGVDESDPRCAALKEKLCAAVQKAHGCGYTHFICGMARGCDQFFFEAVEELKTMYGEVTIEAAVPCLSQPDLWPEPDRKRYERALEKCDSVTLLQEDYTPDCMKKRNYYMVDRSSLLITVFDGGPGGTASTVCYAKQQGVGMMELWL